MKVSYKRITTRLSSHWEGKRALLLQCKEDLDAILVCAVLIKGMCKRRELDCPYWMVEDIYETAKSGSWAERGNL